MTVPRDVLDLDRGLTEWCILHGYRGSVAHGMFRRAEEVYDRSTLPPRPDRERVNRLCVELVLAWVWTPLPASSATGARQAESAAGG